MKRSITVELTPNAAELLRQIVSYGIWGATVEEVVTRIVDERLQEYVGLPAVLLPPALDEKKKQ